MIGTDRRHPAARHNEEMESPDAEESLPLYYFRRRPLGLHRCISPSAHRRGPGLHGVGGSTQHGGRHPLLFLLLFTDRAAFRVRLQDLWYFVGTGIFSVLFFNWCYFNAISLSALSVAAVLLYTSPVFVMLLSALCFQEPITPRKIGALLLTFCGCVLVAGLFPAGVGSISAAAVLFGLGSGFGYALYSIFSKLALKRYSPSTITFYTFLFSALGSLPLSRLWEDASLLLDPRAILGGLGIGVLCCILPYLLYTEGLRWAEPGKAAILATVEPFVAALIGIFAFHEAVTPYKLLGMAAIFGAILILNRRP